MVYVKCPKCHASLIIHENDTTPGCRDTEEVFCPNCDNNEPVTKVFTSGIPYVEVESTND